MATWRRVWAHIGALHSTRSPHAVPRYASVNGRKSDRKNVAKMNTIDALVAREVDKVLASKLSGEGHTVKTLCLRTPDYLRQLGISEESLPYFHKERRPPIPEATITRLINSCRNTCCVCRNNRHGVVIHHIEAWAKCKSHEIANLILLCPNCHDQAHSTKELSQNLSPKRLIALKAAWIDEVKKYDKAIIEGKNQSGLQEAMWDYFNHNRILELSHTTSRATDFQTFFDKGRDSKFVYSGTIRHASPYTYFVKRLSSLLDKFPYVVVDNRTTKREMLALVKNMELIVFTGSHYFKKMERTENGPGQTRKGYHRRKGILIEFLFDGWECTSVSAHGLLSGQTIRTSVLMVRSIEICDARLRISGTCLAIGNGVVPSESITPNIALEHWEDEFESFESSD